MRRSAVEYWPWGCYTAPLLLQFAISHDHHTPERGLEHTNPAPNTPFSTRHYHCRCCDKPRPREHGAGGGYSPPTNSTPTHPATLPRPAPFPTTPLSPRSGIAGKEAKPSLPQILHPSPPVRYPARHRLPSVPSKKQRTLIASRG